MKHYGDITKLSGYDLPPVDVITGGSPCQDLSIAGKRAGLDGERSGLFMEQIRIVKEMRERDRANGNADEFIRPRYMVWENVVGTFSSNDGKDFQAVLTEIVKIVQPEAPDVPMPKHGKWSHYGSLCGVGADGNPFSVGWRVHDAQYWGVPQRRKRICVLADFGGLTAPGILFDPQLERTTEDGEPVKIERSFREQPASEVQTVQKGLSRDIEPSGTGREEAAGSSGKGVERASGAISFQERAGKPGGGKGILIQDERTGALSTLNNQSVCVERSPDSVLVKHSAYSFDSLASNSMKSSNPVSGCRETDVAKTLDCADPAPNKNQGGIAIVQTSAYCLQGNGIDRADTADCNGKGWTEDVSYTLNTIDRPAVMAFSQNQRDVAGSLAAETGMKQQTFVAAVDGRNFTESTDVNGTLQSRGGDTVSANTIVRVMTNERKARRKIACVRRSRQWGGDISPTLTGDHQNRITDYTAIVVDIYESVYPDEICRICGER